jgi:hypothetical protein
VNRSEFLQPSQRDRRIVRRPDFADIELLPDKSVLWCRSCRL